MTVLELALIAAVAVFTVGYVAWALAVWRRRRTLYVDRYRAVPPDLRGVVARMREREDTRG